jgi:hypothetical protein
MNSANPNAIALKPGRKTASRGDYREKRKLDFIGAVRFRQRQLKINSVMDVS